MDTGGLVLGAHVHSASLHDPDGAQRLLSDELREDLPRLEMVWADGAYTRGFREWAEEERGWRVEVPHHPERQLWRYGLEEKPRGFRVLPRRWVVERTFAWLGQARRRFWEQIRGSAEAGRTVLLTTHYLEEADALADRIVVVDRGRVVVDDTSESIKAYVDRKRVRFETQNKLGPGFFEDLPVSGLSIKEGAVAFVSPAPEEILTRLIKANVKFSNLEVVGADLEEAFLELTKKESPIVDR